MGGLQAEPLPKRHVAAFFFFLSSFLCERDFSLISLHKFFFFLFLAVCFPTSSAQRLVFQVAPMLRHSGGVGGDAWYGRVDEARYGECIELIIYVWSDMGLDATSWRYWRVRL